MTEALTVTQFSKILLTAAVALALACLLGCPSHTSIADITRDPAHYSGKDITVIGQASDAFGGFGNGFFQLDDGTGRIWVLSGNYGLPGNGDKVAVTGQIQQGVSFGGHNYGVILRQTKARD